MHINKTCLTNIQILSTDFDACSGHTQKSQVLLARDRLIWLFWGQYRYIGHSWTDKQYFKNF